MTRSRLILLDANVVIQLFQLGIWEQITARCEIVLAQTVVDEVQFYETDTERKYVDWEHWKTACSMRIESVPPADVQAYCSKFGPGYYEKLDPGEAEALALLVRDTDSKICSADKIVWRVLGNTNATERGISLEEILTMSGLTKPIPHRFTKAFREKWCREGSVEGFMGRGDQTLGH
ncbi:MAG: hypothetical protein Tsb0013_07790 [Phycisphaerales bacterium]